MGQPIICPNCNRPFHLQRDLDLHIIQEQLVKCQLRCDGITNNRATGIIPRCLHLELLAGKKQEKCTEKESCIVVGLNPGKVKPKEKQFYKENECKWDSFSKFFENGHGGVPYFQRARDLICTLGFGGEILWTDLAKCECSGKNGTVPVHTLGVCIDQFFKREIALFPDWPIFALGNRAFEFCALSYPNHLVVGLYHPSGARGWGKFEANIRTNLNTFQTKIASVNKKDANGYFGAIHLARIP